MAEKNPLASPAVAAGFANIKKCDPGARSGAVGLFVVMAAGDLPAPTSLAAGVADMGNREQEVAHWVGVKSAIIADSAGNATSANLLLLLLAGFGIS